MLVNTVPNYNFKTYNTQEFLNTTKNMISASFHYEFEIILNFCFLPFQLCQVNFFKHLFTKVSPPLSIIIMKYLFFIYFIKYVE